MIAELLQRRIVAAHQATGFDDWWFALFTAACAETGDAEKALEIADKVYAEQPTENVFCATGEGGGVDPSCSRDATKLPKAGNKTQDGYKITKNIPEKEEQEASFRQVAVVKNLGVREVPLTYFGGAASLKGVTGDHLERIKKVAERIKKVGIDPIVAAHDDKTTYTLDGDHRLKAMVYLGAKTIPAYLLLDKGPVD